MTKPPEDPPLEEMPGISLEDANIRDAETGSAFGFERNMEPDSSRPGAKWGDCFVGSGTALIAGEQTARTVYAMELDPRYVDVSIHRWEDFTGKTAMKLTSNAR